MSGWVARCGARLKGWARAIRRDLVALWLAARNPRTPWTARAFALLVAAYALSPVDLIPDVIPVLGPSSARPRPVLGWLDEAVLLPLAIPVLVRMIPAALMAEHRARAAAMADRPVSRLGLAVVVGIWGAGAVAWWVWPE